jgi:hypothetical protein
MVAIIVVVVVEKAAVAKLPKFDDLGYHRQWTHDDIVRGQRL